jgi:hypothetical protein
MAAQPNLWGTMVIRQDTVPGRIAPRRETNVLEPQGYRQSLPRTKGRDIASADLFADVLVDARNRALIIVLEEPLVRAETLERDPLATILIAIDELISPDEDSGDPPATEHAYRNARAVVEAGYGHLARHSSRTAVGNGTPARDVRSLPVPIVTTDERGGVRLSWQHGDRHVRVNFAAAEGLRSYLYFESPAEHEVQTLQPYNLSNRLNWMLNA